VPLAPDDMEGDMPRAGSRTAIHASVWGIISVLAIVAATPADARRHASHKGHAAHGHSAHASHSGGDSPRYSDIVVDANSGATLHESSPDGLRHPASLTKIMTLYLLFEQLEAGKLTLQSKIDVSEHSASQSPTKLGVPAGGTIAVEDAIKAIVTRSANDIACAIGEKLGGDEETFAAMMTKKAHALGMSKTLYRNASGLPDDEQVTTARDQALLGRAIQERFPRYYKFFSTRVFTYHGHDIANHNHLLGSVEGVDGIKTGFVSASGFNLVTSIRRGGHHLVAVVMGGETAGSRDARMRELISQYVNKGSLQHTAAAVGEGPHGAATRTAMPKVAPAPNGSMAKTADAPFVTASAPASTAQQPVPEAQPAPRRTEATVAMVSPLVGSSDDIRPIPVRTLHVRATTLKSASIGSEPEAAHAVVPVAPAAAPAEPEAEPEPAATPSPAMPVSEAAPAPRPAPQQPVMQVAAASPSATPAPVVAVAATTPPPPATPVVAAAPPPPAPVVEPVREAKQAPAPIVVPPPAPAAPAVAVAQPAAPAKKAAAIHEPPTEAAHEPARDGWVIQVGALQSVSEAQERLGSAKSSAASILKRADPFTEKVMKGDKTLYRARFAGLDKSQAEAACRALKHSDIPCILVAVASKN
jgi:D-alanyl-D-alanine carboxypeptidase